jgi:hypothetical protein
VDGLVLSSGTELPVTGVFVELGAKGLIELAESMGVKFDEEMKHIQAGKGKAISLLWANMRSPKSRKTHVRICEELRGCSLGLLDC